MREVRPFETTDLALTAVFAYKGGFEIELDARNPDRVIFLVTPPDKAEQVAKDYFYHRTLLKHRLFAAKPKDERPP